MVFMSPASYYYLLCAVCGGGWRVGLFLGYLATRTR